MSLGFDLTVNNYSVDDLFTLLGLDSNPSIPEVNNKLNIFIDIFTGISGENTELIIEFFKDVGKKLNDDFFTGTELRENNYFNYTQNFQANNGSTATLPFPMLSFDENHLDREELVHCKDVEVNGPDSTFTRVEEDTPAPTNYKRVSQFKEFSTENIITVSGVPERTTFKYSFPTITNVTSIYLSNISLPIPYTISDYKNNNIFKIIDNNSGTPHTINLEHQYLVYYTDIDEIINYLNQNHFNSTANGILSEITVSKISAGSGRYKLLFQLSNSPTYTTFTIDFDVSYNNICIDFYNLNTILGFSERSYTSDLTSKSISGGAIILKQPKLYIYVDDSQVNYKESLELIGSSILTNYLLGVVYINASDLASNDHILVNTMFTTEVSEFSREYFGVINLDSFVIKFYDVNGILQQIPEDNFNKDHFYFKIKFLTLQPDNS